MKIIDTKKSKDLVSDLAKKASDSGKKATTGVAKGARDLAEKAKNESYVRKLKKYNPLFPDRYFSDEFNCPNLITIVDDAVRRDIDVCEGAIGWLSKGADMEVLHLYDEAVEMSGIKFIPTATCDAVYYVSSFDRNIFIRTDCIFSRAHEERMAELKSIAHSLGAKSCEIEISESSVEISSQKKSFASSSTANISSVKATQSDSAEQNSSAKISNQRSGRIVAEFEGSDTPTRPELKWFANDDTIKGLIEMRCTNTNSIKSETLILSGSSSAAMSQKTAYAIDSAVSKLGARASTNMETEAVRENTSKLIFNIKF